MGRGAGACLRRCRLPRTGAATGQRYAFADQLGLAPARDPAGAYPVLAHEIAHVVRRDWAMLILARLVVALFWFNPLMWLLERRLIEEAEEAVDARAFLHVAPQP